MTEEERRRCCLLGGCGCGAGSAEQRKALREWLVSKLAAGLAVGDQTLAATVDGWLDELPWKAEA